MVTPVNPPSSSKVMVISVSSTAVPFKVSLAVTSPAVPPATPSTGVAVKSFSTASMVPSTTISTVVVSQLLGTAISQIVYVKV